jgi:capsular exopolysaccharide synthesis family protein
MLAHRVVVSKKKVFAVTSAGPQEGKSTTTANLSVALAEIGNRVLVVSANLRRPTLHAFFGVAESPGIREAVSGSMPASPVQTPVKDVMLLPSGSGDSSGISETLASSKFPEMITRLAAGFDYVVVDVPPAGAVADLFHLNTVIDAVLIVCMVGRAKTQSVQAVAGSVREMGLEVVGVVLNDAAGSGMPEYGYSYGYDASGQAQ